MQNAIYRDKIHRLYFFSWVTLAIISKKILPLSRVYRIYPIETNFIDIQEALCSPAFDEPRKLFKNMQGEHSGSHVMRGLLLLSICM